MRNRKRHTAQPMLEPMEPRVVPSVTGIHAHHEQAVAAHVGQMNDSAKAAAASQRENNEALQHLQQQEYLVHDHALWSARLRPYPPQPNSGEPISNFFKSLEVLCKPRTNRPLVDRFRQRS